MAVQAGKFGGGLPHRNDAPMQGIKAHGTLQLLDHGRAQHPCASRSLHHRCLSRPNLYQNVVTSRGRRRRGTPATQKWSRRYFKFRGRVPQGSQVCYPTTKSVPLGDQACDLLLLPLPTYPLFFISLPMCADSQKSKFAKS